MSESPRPNQSFAEVAESLGSQPLTSPTIVHAVPLQPSKLSQDFIQTSTDSSPDGAQGIFDEAGALYFIHQLEQGSPNANPRPEPGMDGQNGSLKSEISPYSQFVQPTVAPLRPKSASPPPRPASSGRSLPPLDVSHRKPPIQQLPRTPTLDYGPERRPAGARAAPVSNRQDTASSSAQPPLPNGNFRQGRMSQFEDPDADAFAALTYLERDNDNDLDTPAPAPKPSTSSPAVPPPFHPREEPPSIVEPDERAPSPESENASVYKSSFAPSKNAMQRKARTEAQQAAHDAAALRPGRGTAKAKNRANTVGAWGDSSEDEEEEEEDEDEDVDSDGQPVVARDDRSVSNYAASLNQRSTPRGPSPLPSGGDAPLPPPPRPPRNLPPVPVLRGQGLSLTSYFLCFASDHGRIVHDGDSLGPRHMDQYEAGRRSYHEDGVSHGGAAPQGPIPTHAPAPIPPRHMWSQVLDPGHNAGAVPETNPRGTFVQLDAPEQTMTKAFTPHGLLSAGLQDKEDRSAKRQEELARETGASLINVPNKPPPPQTGLLGAITAHERDRKREGGVGAALTEREREKRLAEERQRKLDDYQRQQLEQMQQGGSMYGQQLAGYPMMNTMSPMNPMNPMMMGMGMNSMMPGFMGYPGMVPGFGNPQHMFAAQQAAQAYQQAMYSLSQAGSQIGGDGGAPVPLSPIMTGARLGPSPAPMHPMITGGGMTSASPAPLNPMMTGGGMSVGAFDPRYSMMNMPMMNPMANPMAMGMGMGMGNPGMMGAPMGMGMPMNNGAGFDPRMSQFDPGLQVPNSNFVQAGRAGSSLGLDPSPGAGDGARRSSSASPRPPQ
jgi:CCR4-NOT transcriptional complex subunit CAF120